MSGHPANPGYKKLTAVRALPILDKDTSATRSPIEFAHARKVKPIIVDGIFQKTPKDDNRPTTSFAVTPIHNTAIKKPRTTKTS